VFKTDEISILPNPSHGEFEVSIDRTYMQNAKIQIFNMMGSMVYNDNIYIGQKKIVSINKQPAGIYLLKVTDDGGQITTKKIIKKTTIK
jgi:Secretion system C-terminal sorting domain